MAPFRLFRSSFSLVYSCSRDLCAGSDGNLDEAGERGAAANKAYDVLLFSIVPIQYGLLTYYVWILARVASGVELVGKTLAMGIACGLLGLNVGHELGHRREAFPQFLCKMLYLSTLYMHFFIEHNRGHHANVATDEDAASAARGENLFAFIPRSILGGYRSAWALEAKRLQRRKTSFWSLQNEMIRFQVIRRLGRCVWRVWLAKYGGFVIASFLESSSSRR